MRFTIDTDNKTLTIADTADATTLDLYSADAFHELSRIWVTTGWALKYPYCFSWMGRPVIQLPEDMLAVQEVIYRVKPDVIVETGIAHGGSLVFSASICHSIGKGRVIGIDLDIRPHNRAAIEEHELFNMISLIEGDSIAASTIQELEKQIGSDETVLVILDSNHSRQHVLSELDLYSPFVSRGSYIIATDGVMEWLADVPRGRREWAHDNPKAAVETWISMHTDFVLEDPPPFVFNESLLTERVTHWPSAYLRRL